MHMEEKLVIQLMAIFKSSCAPCRKLLQPHLILATLWTVAHQAPLYRAHQSLTFPPAGDGRLGFKTPRGSRDQGGIPHCLRKATCQKKDQYSGYKFFIRYMTCKYLLLVCGILFNFLKILFRREDASNFDEVQFINVFFMDFTFIVASNKSLIIPRSQNGFPILSF